MALVTHGCVCILAGGDAALAEGLPGDLEGDGVEGPEKESKDLGSRLPPNGEVSWSKSLPFLGPQFPYLQKGRKGGSLTMNAVS